MDAAEARAVEQKCCRIDLVSIDWDHLADEANSAACAFTNAHKERMCSCLRKFVLPVVFRVIFVYPQRSGVGTFLLCGVPTPSSL
jgi:hypothetical protein